MFRVFHHHHVNACNFFINFYIKSWYREEWTTWRSKALDWFSNGTQNERYVLTNERSAHKNFLFAHNFHEVCALRNFLALFFLIHLEYVEFQRFEHMPYLFFLQKRAINRSCHLRDTSRLEFYFLRFQVLVKN